CARRRPGGAGKPFRLGEGRGGSRQALARDVLSLRAILARRVLLDCSRHAFPGSPARRAGTPAASASGRRGALAVVLPCLFSGCGGPQSILFPAGPAAAQIAELWWLMLGVFGLVFLWIVAL